ncbi:unnamed protein product [Paramecium sonneborni]|uniref:Uncharacterized protein n=1 Tax=Paramecium sonneborni TaxID=65129 RepID=A0A8S1KGI5_9CILI|nr:unnamed protein product [Paramecium sonneborni]
MTQAHKNKHTFLSNYIFLLLKGNILSKDRRNLYIIILKTIRFEDIQFEQQIERVNNTVRGKVLSVHNVVIKVILKTHEHFLSKNLAMNTY